MGWIWPPHRIPVVNEGLGWDPLLKMVHNPGGHWNPVRGPHPSFISVDMVSPPPAGMNSKHSKIVESYFRI